MLQDRGIYHQTFTHHWLACRDRIHQFEPQSEKSADDILTVSAQLDQMMQLLQLELGATNNNGETRILDTILSDSDNILAQVFGILLLPGEHLLIFCSSDCWLGQESSLHSVRQCSPPPPPVL